jgi:hypothetical protein
VPEEKEEKGVNGIEVLIEDFSRSVIWRFRSSESLMTLDPSQLDTDDKDG